MEDGRFTYLIFGIENQTGIHYAMPVRNMVYDSLQYYSQIRAISRQNRREGEKLSKEEYLSGISKNDRLIPVITLVVYFGANAWNGPKRLLEMFADCRPEIQKYAADYKINLLEPVSMNDEEIEKLKTDLKEVFYFIKYSTDKDKLLELVESNEGFRNMKRSTAEMITAITNSNIKINDREERIDMCLAIEQIREESFANGEARGIAIGEQKILFELVKDGILTVSQASNKAKLTEEQFVAEMRKSGF